LASPVERVASIVASVLLLLPRPASAVAGAALFGIVVAVHWARVTSHKSQVTSHKSKVKSQK
jgi:hypothetical protein